MTIRAPRIRNGIALLLVVTAAVFCSSSSTEESAEPGVHVTDVTLDEDVAKYVDALASDVRILQFDGDLVGATLVFTTYRDGLQGTGYSLPLRSFAEAPARGIVTMLFAVNRLSTNSGPVHAYSIGRFSDSEQVVSRFVEYPPSDISSGIGHSIDDSQIAQGEITPLYYWAAGTGNGLSATWSSAWSAEEQEAEVERLVGLADWVEVLELRWDGQHLPPR